MAFTVKWENRESVMKRLNAIAPIVQVEMAKAQLDIAETLAEKMRKRAPVGLSKWRKPGRRPGRYRRSINGRVLDADDKGKAAVPVGMNSGTTDPYATGIYAEFIWHWIEFGVRGSPARPHIFPTYRAERKYFKRKLQAVLRKGLRKATTAPPLAAAA
jgi:hypothetical protein